MAEPGDRTVIGGSAGPGQPPLPPAEDLFGGPATPPPHPQQQPQPGYPPQQQGYPPPQQSYPPQQQGYPPQQQGYPPQQQGYPPQQQGYPPQQQGYPPQQQGYPPQQQGYPPQQGYQQQPSYPPPPQQSAPPPGYTPTGFAPSQGSQSGGFQQSFPPPQQQQGFQQQPSARPGGPDPFGGQQGQPLAPGVVVNNTYRIEKLIARGGMGEIYRAANVVTGDAVALKTMRPELAGDPKIIELFRREAQALRKIRHPAVVNYEGIFLDSSGALFMAMEFIEGQTLAHQMRAGALPPDQVRRLRDRLAAGLAAAHSQGVVHRDFSPDNVLLPGGRLEDAKIIDFGIAKQAEGQKGTMIGTDFAGKYGYAAPEQLGMFGGKVDHRADIYALGLVLAAAAMGIGLDMGNSPGSAVTARQKVPDLARVPAELREEIAKLLQPEPDKRPASMEDVIGKQTGRRSVVGGADAGGGSGKLVLVAGIVIVAAALGGTGFVFRDEIARMLGGGEVQVAGGPGTTTPGTTPGAGGVATPIPTTPSIPTAPTTPTMPGLPSGPVATPGVPATPTVPGIPTAPTSPTVPGVPSGPIASPGGTVPAVPTIPGIPTIPTVPTIPGVPSGPIATPGAPTTPTVPGIPTIPTVPTIPGVPSGPIATPGVPTTPTVPTGPTIAGIVPPGPVAPPALPEDPVVVRARAMAELARFDCASLTVDVDGGTLAVSGFVESEGDRAALTQAMAGISTAHQVRARIAVHPRPICDGLTVMGQHTSNDLRVEVNRQDRTYQIGKDSLSFRVSAAGSQRGVTHVAIVNSDGTISRIPEWQQMRLDPGHTLRFGGPQGFELAPPQGQMMVVAVHSPRPIFPSARPDEEPAIAFFNALREALERQPAAVVAYAVIDTR